MSTEAGSLVLFDIDGTLIRGAGPHHRLALIDGIRKVTGRETSLEGIATAGTLDRDLIAGMLRKAGVSWREIAIQMRAIVEHCQQSYLANCDIDLRPFVCRNVPETLRELKEKGCALGLVTGNLTEIGWRKIEFAGLRSFFSVGAFAEDGRTRSQLALVAAQRARRLNLSARNSRISLVGDHANDISAAKANGFQSVAVATGVMSRDELGAHSPDILVDHLGELDLNRLT